jgi:hypothetical protein
MHTILILIRVIVAVTLSTKAVTTALLRLPLLLMMMGACRWMNLNQLGGRCVD